MNLNLLKKILFKRENFETSDKNCRRKQERQSEVEKKAAYAQNRINKAVAQAKDFQDVNLWLCNMLNS